MPQPDTCDLVATHPSYQAPEVPDFVEVECGCGEWIATETVGNNKCKTCEKIICTGCKEHHEGKCRECDEKEETNDN